MRDWLKKWLGDLPGVTLWELARYILSLVVAGAAGLLAGDSAARLVGFFAPYRTLLAVAGMALGLLVFIQLHRQISPNYAVLPRFRFLWRIADKEVQIKYHDRLSADYLKRIVLVPMKHGMRTYEDRYWWTGSDPVTIKVKSGPCTAVQTEQEGVWQYYELRFDHNLDKGKPVEVELQFDLSSRTRPAGPFISASVFEPTKALKIVACFADGVLGSPDAICELRPAFGPRSTSRPMVKRVRDNRIEWPVKPRLGYDYEIRWNWAIDPPKSEAATPNSK